MPTQPEQPEIVAVNRKAFHDYTVEETFEAGLALTGTEIKSLRQGAVDLREGYARPEGGELWLYGVHIAPYAQGTVNSHEPKRKRKLLLHRREIDYLSAKVQERGLTLVPLRVYIKRGRAKVALGLARGKKQYDKREAIARREAERAIAQALKAQRSGDERARQRGR
ncbi:MAG: SsrA-binding protein SmpB [Chloroflexi bacterium]|jgi:SsrA-binding protein|nr:SsrA-binding protein SmpB [Chloroflexota bacterium]GIW10885.1 MAG: SsrA-binding protein [Dehalococcoidia bacterium]